MDKVHSYINQHNNKYLNKEMYLQDNYALLIYHTFKSKMYMQNYVVQTSFKVVVKTELHLD